MVACPVCRTELGTIEQAEALGAFVFRHGDHVHAFDSSTCRDAFASSPKKFH